MNIWDILILLAVAGVVAAALFIGKKRKASGRGSCCRSCEGCHLCEGKKTKSSPTS